MATPKMKEWLDQEVVPLLGDDLKIHSFIWNGDPPKEILVWLLSKDDSDTRQVDAPPPAPWPTTAKRLIDAGFRFDFLREVQLVNLEGQLVPIFGGDGAPIFNKTGTASIRLIRTCHDGTHLILQVGARYDRGQQAADAIKEFFALFEEPPLEVCSTYSAPFGLA